MKKKEKENENENANPMDALPVRSRTSALLRLLVPILCLAVLVLFSLTIHYGYRRLYQENPAFLLSHIEIAAPADSLRDNAGACLQNLQIMEGMTTLTSINLRRLRDELMRNPRVASVEIQRIFPDTLRIAVKPRVPVAILRFPPETRQGELKIDQEGYVVPFDLPGITSNLPRITGLAKPENFVVGQKTEDVSVLAFLAFLKLCSLRSDGANYEVAIARLDTENEKMTLLLEANEPFRQSAQLVLPTTNLPAQLDRIGIVVELRRNNNQTISYLNATYSNIPVRP